MKATSKGQAKRPASRQLQRPSSRESQIGAGHAVFFDCGQTLIDADPTVAQMFVRVARAHGHDISLDQVQPHTHAVNRYYDMEYMKDGSFWASPERSVGLWYDIHRFMCHLTGLTDDVEQLSDDMFKAYLRPENWGVYSDVRATLSTLKRQGYRLAVVSNWDPSLENLLRGLGLLPYFDEVLSSAAVGYRKPNPTIFELAGERLGIPAAQCAHVGDNVEADGDGAAAASVHPVILDRAGTLEKEEARTGRGYPVVRTLTEVPDAVARIFANG
jgi:putative hydrolase of the HAD superfamily